MANLMYVPQNERPARKGPREFTGRGIALKIKAGMNVVPDDRVNAYKDMPAFKTLQATGALTIMGQGEASVSPKEPGPGDLKVADLAKFVATVEDIQLLQRWLAEEKREKGKQLIAARIDALQKAAANEV